jgi:hypothetical protein
MAGLLHDAAQTHRQCKPGRRQRTCEAEGHQLRLQELLPLLCQQLLVLVLPVVEWQPLTVGKQHALRLDTAQHRQRLRLAA